MRIDEEEIVRAQEDGSLGQVISGRKYWSDGTPVAGQQFDYTFDDIGNRKTTAAGGDQNGVNLRTANYTNNTLNQLIGRDVPGYLNILGSATNTATVTVNNTATSRKSAYYRAELTAANTNALWFSVTNVAVRNNGTNADTVATTMGNVLLAKTPETFTYDADGNLASNGLWTNTWNAENRLIFTESRTNVPTAARMKEEWSYLPDGRWYRRIVSTNNGTSWATSFTNRYVWDGKVLLAVLDHTNGLVMSLTRGIDLSGTEQGAGGVGGLLAVSFKTEGTHFAAYDGNGNVVALVSATNGTATANYEYDPFGQTIRITGHVAKLNLIRFSTQYADEVSGNLKYLYRDYDPSMGRWLSRDPLGETGGANLFGFTYNSPLTFIDALGLCSSCKCKKVKGGPFTDRVLHRGSQPGVNKASLQLMVPWEVEVEGDATKCHCRYIDDGSIKGIAYLPSGKREESERIFPREITDPWPCKNYVDFPGVTFPQHVDFIYSLRFNLSVTFECEDEDGSGKISDTVNINALFMGRYPASWPELGL